MSKRFLPFFSILLDRIASTSARRLAVRVQLPVKPAIRELVSQRCGILTFAAAAGLPADRPFVIRILDNRTGRGVPLVELRAANQRTWFSDSNGVVSISDPWAMGQVVSFPVRSDGYRFEERVFDMAGIALPVNPGGRVGSASCARTLASETIA